MNDREKLISELKVMVNKNTPIIVESDLDQVCQDLERFILARGKKIVEPLVRNYDLDPNDKSVENLFKSMEMVFERIDETLKNAGVEAV